jgi:hypothetical protein
MDTCDHCYLCDVVGVCCASVTSTAPASPCTGSCQSCQHDDRLREAVVAERLMVVNLAALVRAEALSGTAIRLALLAAPAALLPDINTNCNQKEGHVHVARSEL